MDKISDYGTLLKSQNKNEKRFKQQIKKWYNLAPQYENNWKGQHRFSYLCILYLALRYRVKCIPNDEWGFNYPLVKLQFRLGTHIYDEFNKKMIKRIADCIHRYPNEPFVVLVDVDRTHANMIIYNPATHSLEHFEPVGYSNIHTNMLDDISNAFELLIQRMNANHFADEDWIKYLSVKQTCPQNFGLQINELDVRNEHDNFCAAWSFMIAELHLMFPTFGLNTIQTKIRDILPLMELKTEADKLKTYETLKLYGYLDKNITFNEFNEKYPTQSNYDPRIHNINLIKGYVADLTKNLTDYVGFAIGKQIKLDEAVTFFQSESNLLMLLNPKNRILNSPENQRMLKRFELYQTRNKKTPRNAFDALSP